VDKNEVVIGSHPDLLEFNFFTAGFFDAFLHNLACISGKTNKIFMKISVTDLSLNKEVPVKL